MSMDRREFIKIAGLSALLGIGGKGAFELLRPGELDASEGHSSESAPRKGAQPKIRWAMTIDVRKCDSQVVQKCRDVCNYFHNVPDFGKKDEIKWIWGDTYEHAFADGANEYIDESLKERPFLLLCNHCDKPPCVRVCPTKATFKRPDGIVAMDYHRCIGCRFCMAACPFGSRSFNWRDPREGLKGRKLNPEFPTRMRGVVEKCNFCVERIDKGLIPACVEAVPEVMTFGNLADPNSNVRQVLRGRTSMRRKIELGTEPSVFYLV
ncbi:MAG: sulfate reduction electron transfer complex DsrMKJOP subunit DsrO [Dissulfurimicrobium sp.]|uniref:sulfate reduction electron transfer complex DsrMKJOP subunit DsrO n=1 Tax=Dissulfurimicrobium sp. TaxID=2022436 RepID=UPI00404AC5FF